MRKPLQGVPFYGLNDRIPVLLSLLLGLQQYVTPQVPFTLGLD